MTGALLNHTVDWKLDEKTVDHPLVMDAYGMSPKGDPVGLEMGGLRVAGWDGQVFVDGRRLDVQGDLLGAVADGDGLAVVTSTQVVRLDRGGETVEVLDGVALPGSPLTGVQESGRQIFLRHDGTWHEVLDGWLEFRAGERVLQTQELKPVADQAERRALRKAWSQGGLPVSRILLDLHAARFLGGFSTYFYDLVAVTTIILCVTGVILFFRQPRRPRNP